ncbi:MAG: helix-turn-helix transcriptional regulator, partial [Chloroflexi bacterium]|nr:helix-turn-helix transcriptional regulator [Chloroflexota bacterium]
TPENRPKCPLSERELTILKLIADGVTTDGIAHQLFLSEATVKRSVRTVFDILGVRNRSEAVAEAYKRGII